MEVLLLLLSICSLALVVSFINSEIRIDKLEKDYNERKEAEKKEQLINEAVNRIKETDNK